MIRLEDANLADSEVECASVDDARNLSVALLGRHLQDHPEFAISRHWRVDLLDAEGRLILHVIVATVDAPRSLNFASFG